jgi:LmbE family N-acetylglucosaminyl deacetylase
MSKHRLLIAYAHPDDESFGNGGLIAKYVKEGAEVYLICATDGDMGTIPDEMHGQFQTVRELRLAELDCASEILGFKQVYKFGYKDSGMMGSESSNDPACLWYQWTHHPQEVTKRVVEVIREVQPHVILTFNRYGGYGHPDHIAIQRATLDAFELAADPTYRTDGQDPWKSQKLYYSAIPGLMLRFFLFLIRLRGQDPRKMGVNNDIDFQAVVDNIEPVHTEVHIGDYLEDWDRASACHQSQGGGRFMPRLPMWARKLFTGKQGLTRVYPQPERHRIDETDLFAGVVLSGSGVERQ